MKLEDIKDTIDTYFENISGQELFDLLTKKYHMPVTYDIDMSPAISNISVKALTGSEEIDYQPVQTSQPVISEVITINSANNTDGINRDDSQMSDKLSYAA